MEEHPVSNDAPNWITDELIESTKSTFVDSAQLTRSEAIQFVCLVGQLLDLTEILDMESFNETEPHPVHEGKQ